jgi:hypothetical protein
VQVFVLLHLTESKNWSKFTNLFLGTVLGSLGYEKRILTVLFNWRVAAVKERSFEFGYIIFVFKLKIFVHLL